MANKKYIILALLLLFLSVFVYMSNDRDAVIPSVLASEISMVPTKHDSAGIDLDTEFTFSAGDKLDPKFIAENIIIEPAVTFTVKKNNANFQEVILVPQESLNPQMVYKFTLNLEGQTPLKWAFQTKGDFKVISTLPRDKSTGVPIDTGIEINFSHLDYGDVNQYLTIEPQVKGSFEVHKKTLVFVPEKLQPATLYTITVKKGLPLNGSNQKLNEDYVFQFETREEASGKESPIYFDIYKNNHEFTTQEKPFFQLGYFNYGHKKESLQGKVSVFTYKNSQEFIKALEEKEKIPQWSYYSRRFYREDTSRLSKVSDFSLPIQGYENFSFLEFPEAMAPGYYLAEISIGETKKQLWFQVTDLGVYGAVSDNKTLFWVNDLMTGQPVPGAEVEIHGGKTGKTDATGLLELASPSDLTKGVFGVIKSGQRECVAAIYPWYNDPKWEQQSNFQNAYWRYFYLDRSIYKPNDTVHFWGVIKPREDKDKLPGKVTVSITKWTGGNENSVIESKDVAISDYNFTGNLKLPNLLPGYYYLEAKINNQTLMTQYFDVENYSKPVYQLEVTPVKKAYFAGEKAKFQVKATFFEGTGASNIPLNYHIHDQNGTITTNAQGEAEINYLPSYRADISYSPLNAHYLYLTADLPESGEISGESQILVLNNDISINSQGKVIDNTAQINLEVNKMTLDKVNSGQVDTWEKDAFLDKPSVNHLVKAKVYEEVWEKREYGQYYDFINKKVMPRYEYIYKKVPYTEGEVTTDNSGKALFSFPTENKKSYIVEFSAQDFRGNLAFKEQRVFGSDFTQESEYIWYHLEKEKPTGKYSLGEEVKTFFKQNQALISARENGFLFFTCRNGILQGKIQNNGLFSTTFSKELLPNFWISGVYFDGRYYYATPQEIVSFDEQEKALEIKVTLDQEEYRPGDTVKASLEVKDNKERPVAAHVNLSLVDEALFALQNQYANVLYGLYGNNLPSGVKGTFLSHQAPEPGLGGAEKGGEGGGERKDFKDTVFFKTVTTDKDGKGSVEFQVPDNLTSWRLTCQAITPDLGAGTKTLQVRVKLPFFVDMILADKYLTGDEVTVPIRSFGSQLKSGSIVEYQATLKSGQDIVSKETISAEAFKIQGVSLPPLKKGNYEFTLTGKTSENLTDTLTLGFQVVDSLQTKGHTEFFSLEKNLALKAQSDSPVTLVFADYQKSLYLDLLWRLKMAGGERIDQKIAQVFGDKLMAEYFPELSGANSEDTVDFLKFQVPQGGIAILPYGDSDLELSVKLVALLPEVFDRMGLVNYFSSIVNDPKESRERAIIALAGLGVLNEPVLHELSIVNNYQDLTVKEQLYLSFALMELGDENNAKARLKPLLAKTENLGSSLRLNTGVDQDDILEATAIMALLAEGLNFAEEADKLLAYVLENNSQDILLYPEKLLFLEKALPKLSKKPVSFSYKLDNKKEKVTLTPEKTFSLILTLEKIKEIEFSDISGQVGVSAYYELPFTPPAGLSTDGVKVTRQYEVTGKATNELKMNDLVRVKIAYQFGAKAPDGPYKFIDFLPAGLKIVHRPFYRGVNDKYLGYPVEVNGQKAVFYIYGRDSGHFTYYARVINPGRFRAEQGILEHGKSGVIYSVTEKGEVNIK